jgi:hypothetical protein
VPFTKIFATSLVLSFILAITAATKVTTSYASVKTYMDMENPKDNDGKRGIKACA